ncbi:MAG: Transcription initiation factor TFIID subunit 5 [Piccolia ochrophora]|nr:MAG: Transcription initiation factor TFIID subunit 5 [Piccolia ochrophora]
MSGQPPAGSGPSGLPSAGNGPPGAGMSLPPPSQQQQSQQHQGNAAPSGGGGPPAVPPPSSNLSQQNLNSIVIEYLNKKGYNRTEAMLRAESANTDQEGRPLYERAEHKGGEKYRIAFQMTRNWIDQSLEIYKAELKRTLWPLFVYFYLSLVEELYQRDLTVFFQEFEDMFQNEFETDLRKLGKLYLPEHLKSSETAQVYLKNKYRITLSTSAHFQFMSFLEAHEKEGGSVVTKILQEKCSVIIGRGAAEPHSLAAILNKARPEDDMPGEEEGIPGHLPGLVKGSSITQAGLPKLKLGALPMEPELLADVRMELEEEDAANAPKPGEKSLLEDLNDRIKREESEEGPARADVPLPPSLARDVTLEVNALKEHRNRYKIEGRTGGAGPGVSVCMFTFHNTYDGVTCMDFSQDDFLVAIGTHDSYIMVFSLDGKPLHSMMAAHPNDPPPSSRRRLIGHSGPVFAVSFSPSIAVGDEERKPEDTSFTGPRPRHLVSCSEDKTIRLWSCDAWQCLVVYKGHLGPVWDVTWGPKGHYFLSGGHDRTGRLWSVEQIAAVRFFVGHDQDVDVVSFHPNNLYVFSGSSDRTVRMFSIASGDCVRLFTGHTGNITALACSHDGKVLASADDGGSIILWALDSGNRLKRMRGHGKGGIWSLSWSAESTVLMSGGADGTVRVWDRATPSETSATVQGKSGLGDSAAGAKADASGTAAASGATTTAAAAAAAATAATAGAGPGGKKKGKEVVVTPDQISAFPTKKSPVYKVRFTRTNLGVAGGVYLP